MSAKTILVILIALLLNSLPLSAGSLFSGSEITVAETTPVASSSENNDPFPLKNAKHYNESNDPAFKRCGTNSDGPQHGYFAVPLLVLGLAGVLLYFSKSS